ncbi:regulatory protein [Actinosynnema pretiosum subsp. pretiosum]|nr:regulatory protein [Actinosynnema pretiosum subsp. pretiosum]
MPPDLARRLQPIAGVLVRDAVQEIRRSVPAYAQPLEGKFREVLVGSVETAIFQCFESIVDPDAPTGDWQAVLRYSGRVEFLEGRTMDALQNAVRVGARVVWRHLSEHGRELGLPSDALFAVADAIFAWVDELCRVAVEGYTEAQAGASGALERRRRQLLKVLLGESPASARSLADLAASTDWRLPERVAVVALEYREDQHQLPSPAFGRDVLLDLESSEPCLVLGGPADRRGLEAELRGRRAAVGPVVPLADARRSLGCARRALGLVRRGLLPQARVTWCEEHLAVLALLADEFLVEALVGRALEVFAHLTAKQRHRLETTLLAWLGTRGGVVEVAARLGVHPQTVRYRMHQVERLLGDRLDDPDERLALEMALRARLLLHDAKPVERARAGVTALPSRANPPAADPAVRKPPAANPKAVNSPAANPRTANPQPAQAIRPARGAAPRPRHPARSPADPR